MKKLLSLIVVFISSVMLLNAEEVTSTVSNAGGTGIVANSVKYWSDRKTVYSPEDWRPGNGDKVKISYYTKTSRDGSKQKLVIDNLTLIQLNPANKIPESPVEGIVQNPGKKWIDVKVGSKIMKFEKNRKRTVYEPTGFIPAPGQKVRITFSKVPAKFGTSKIMNVIDKIELLK